MTLALLITAAASAWAQTETLLTTITATGQTTYSESTAGVVTVSHDNDYFDNTYGWLWWSHAGSVTVEAKDGYTITRCVFSQPYKTPFTVSTAPFKVDFIETSDPEMPEFKQYLCQGYMDGVSSIEVYGYAAPAGPAVTIADGNGEASFEMPTNDVTVNYELVRDMSVSMTTKIGDGNDGYRIRLKKSEQNPGKYEPAEMTAQQMKALVKVHDAIENYDLTFGVQDANCIVNIYKANDENQAVGEPIAFSDLTPGRYIAKAVAATGSAYEGETALSNIFTLYQGYEVQVAAKEFITYYKDEPLYVEDEDAVLYTISSVNGDQAVLSDKSDAMPSNTPMLVYNKSNETKVILLIPCAEPDMAITVAPEFVGTLEATTIAASTDAQTNYALNGKQFVWVKDDITVGANKAWLSISSQQAPTARQISIVFGDATSISAVSGSPADDNSFYDLSGRKVTKPTKKGVYIMNGKKVVVK